MGRFQLAFEGEETTFLVDSATGRVWRYAIVSVESEVAREVERIVYARVLASPETESQAEIEDMRQEVRQEVRAELTSPCHGFLTCFVEVDRVSFSETGLDWISEIVRNP